MKPIPHGARALQVGPARWGPVQMVPEVRAMLPVLPAERNMKAKVVIREIVRHHRQPENPVQRNDHPQSQTSGSRRLSRYSPDLRLDIMTNFI